MVAEIWRYAHRAQPLIDGSDPRDLFGGTYGSLESHDLVIFADSQPEGTTHWIEWKTRRPMRLERVRVRARGDQRTGRREFSEVRIYGRNSATNPWNLLEKFTPVHPYAFEDGNEGLVCTMTLPTPAVAQQFRAEFIQGKAPDGTSNGPRVLRLEGMGEWVR